MSEIMHAEGNFSHDKLINVPVTDGRRSATEGPAAGYMAMWIRLSDAFATLSGPASEVQAMTAQPVLPGENGHVVSGLIRFHSGRTAYPNAALHTPLYLRFTVFGTMVWAEYRNETHPDTPGRSTLTVQFTGQSPRVTTYDWTDPVRANLGLFAQATRGAASASFTAEQLVGIIAILRPSPPRPQAARSNCRGRFRFASLFDQMAQAIRAC